MNTITIYESKELRQNDYLSCPITMYIIENYEGKLLSKYKENTRKTYGYNGSHFVQFLKDGGGFIDVTLEKYISYLRGLSDCKITTKAARSTACKIIVRRVNHFRQDLIPDSIYKRLVEDIDWIKSPKGRKRSGPTAKQVEMIKDAIEAIEDNSKRHRMRAEFALLGIEGLRASEAARIKLSDFNKATGKLKVLRKRGKEQEIIMNPAAIELLDKYIRFHGIKNGYLFPYKDTHISRNALSMKWKRFFKSLGIGAYTIHDYRHYIGTELSLKGDIHAIGLALGHDSITTSKSYIDEQRDIKSRKQINEVMGFINIDKQLPTENGKGYKIKTNKGFEYTAEYSDGIFFYGHKGVQIGWKGSFIDEELVVGWSYTPIKKNDMVRYYKHKEKHDIICELMGKRARFGKWVWNENICTEVYKFKDVTEDFKNTFEEITQKEFNDIWGKKLEQA